ncbi:MAG TPA: M15 family metallopeptidase [Saprospiraceae bacterium]|nr:M15 family metallopeptidase [Saprospiraceae bacterium]
MNRIGRWINALILLVVLCMPSSGFELLIMQKEVDHRIITGRFDPATEVGFVAIDSKYSIERRYMQEEAYKAFAMMAEAAEKDSIILTIVSATRNFDKQKELWENKWYGRTKVEDVKLTWSHPDPVDRAYKILEYTAPPGFSRHHWGTDIDINSVEPEYFETDEGKNVYFWLIKNAAKFGFSQTYLPKGIHTREHGFNEEKWHWSYLPLAIKYWAQLITSYKPEMLHGFQGYESVRRIPLIEHYIISVNQAYFHDYVPDGF